MRTIEYTGQFKRDYKREAKGKHRATLDVDLIPVLDALADDQPLEPRHHDHALIGEWKDHRDCHIKPYLVLIYQIPDAFLGKIPHQEILQEENYAKQPVKKA